MGHSKNRVLYFIETSDREVKAQKLNYLEIDQGFQRTESYRRCFEPLKLLSVRVQVIGLVDFVILSDWVRRFVNERQRKVPEFQRRGIHSRVDLLPVVPLCQRFLRTFHRRTDLRHPQGVSRR